MSNPEFPTDRRYTQDHEWALHKDNQVLIGVSAFAVEQLGDITLVGIDVAEGDKVEKGKVFGTVESVKTLSDLFAPVSGTVARINTELEDKPELVNEDCYDKGWMIGITLDDASDYEALLDHGAYVEHVKASEH